MARNWFQQFNALFRKNTILHLRNWKGTLFVILSPFLWLGILIAIQNLFEDAVPFIAAIGKDMTESLSTTVPSTPPTCDDPCVSLAYTPSNAATDDVISIYKDLLG
ncbi:hypothetical protein ADUPG1_000863, partial [Aduncisulcus paluster]